MPSLAFNSVTDSALIDSDSGSHSSFFTSSTSFVDITNFTDFANVPDGNAIGYSDRASLNVSNKTITYRVQATDASWTSPEKTVSRSTGVARWGFALRNNAGATKTYKMQVHVDAGTTGLTIEANSINFASAEFTNLTDMYQKFRITTLKILEVGTSDGLVGSDLVTAIEGYSTKASDYAFKEITLNSFLSKLVFSNNVGTCLVSITGSRLDISP